LRDISEQPLQGGALERAARDAAIIVVLGRQLPAFAGLAQHIGSAGLALGIQ